LLKYNKNLKISELEIKNGLQQIVYYTWELLNKFVFKSNKLWERKYKSVVFLKFSLMNKVTWKMQKINSLTLHALSTRNVGKIWVKLSDLFLFRVKKKICLEWKTNTPTPKYKVKLSDTYYFFYNYVGILFLDLDWCTSSRWRCRRNLLWCGCGGNGDNIRSSQECIQLCKLWKESLKYTITFSIITGTTI
jgi:hypothetical protein